MANKLECALGVHTYEGERLKYKSRSRKILITKLCTGCGKKALMQWVSTKRLEAQAIGDCMDGKIVHFMEDPETAGENPICICEQWLSNSGKSWRRKKPKNWKYEGQLVK